jgi:hypothetical protein
MKKSTWETCLRTLPTLIVVAVVVASCEWRELDCRHHGGVLATPSVTSVCLRPEVLLP